MNLIGTLRGESAAQSAAAVDFSQAARGGRVTAHWGLALLAYHGGDQAAAQEEMRQLLLAAPERMGLVHTLYPQDEALARFAEQAHPEQAFAAFWVGETLAQKDLAQAIAAYERGVELAPLDGVRWVELGQLYRRNGQLERALHAYDRACRLRDRGGNGCWRAGLLSEALGQNGKAAAYYRLTLRQIPGYGPALERLEALP